MYELGQSEEQIPFQVFASDQDFVSVLYDQFNFEHPPLMLTGSGLDCAIDNDADGVYDLLQVSLGVRVGHGGQKAYQYSATLMDAQGRKVAIAYGTQSLRDNDGTAPAQGLILKFSGAEIAASRLSGPYVIGGLVLWGNGPTQALQSVSPYRTATYSVRDFIKNVQALNVDERIQFSAGSWQVDPQSGALQGQVTLHNPVTSGCVLELVFWLMFPEGVAGRLARRDGFTEDGQAYCDVTVAMEKQLTLIGNRDCRLDPGEQVSLPVVLFSRTEACRIPHFSVSGPRRPKSRLQECRPLLLRQP